MKKMQFNVGGGGGQATTPVEVKLYSQAFAASGHDCLPACQVKL